MCIEITDGLVQARHKCWMELCEVYALTKMLFCSAERILCGMEWRAVYVNTRMLHCSAITTRSIFFTPHHRNPIAPLSFWCLNAYLCSALVTAVSYVISWYIARPQNAVVAGLICVMFIKKIITYFREDSHLMAEINYIQLSSCTRDFNSRNRLVEILSPIFIHRP